MIIIIHARLKSSEYYLFSMESVIIYDTFNNDLERLASSTIKSYLTILLSISL